MPANQATSMNPKGQMENQIHKSGISLCIHTRVIVVHYNSIQFDPLSSISAFNVVQNGLISTGNSRHNSVSLSYVDSHYLVLSIHSQVTSSYSSSKPFRDSNCLS